MSDSSETNTPSEATTNRLPACDTPETTTPLGADETESSSLMTPDIEREVAAAFADMSPEDINNLSSKDVLDESISPGTPLIGTVVGLTDADVFLEFDVKSQGVVPRSQFGKKESLEIGRRVDVVVERFDAEAGLFIVNRQGAVQRAQWATLEVGAVVQGRATGLIKGGLEIDLQGIRAFMPGSHADVVPMKDISILLNENIRCEVIELDRRSKNLIVSRRKVIEHERKEAAEKLKSELAVGQVRKGVVRNIAEFGAFVDLGGLEGLIHIRELSWGTVDKVTDVLTSGQEVEVQVLKIDEKRNRISLGLKQTQPDPWVGVENRYAVGTSLKAKIVRVADFGAFAELEPGVDGLIPISEMSWKRVNTPSDAVSVGDMVDAAVIRMEPEKRRIALSMKQAQSDPWEGVLDGFKVNEKTKGTVTRLADFGAFVEVAPGVEGLIHISELSDRRVNSAGDVVTVGQEVETRVLGVDKENRRISLSLRTPRKEEAALSDSAPSQPRKKRAKPLRGGLSSHYNW